VLLASDVYQGLFKNVDKDSLPAQQGPFQLVKFDESDRSKDSSWGEHSKLWIYNSVPGQASVVSLDYEFVDWHELTDCYRAQGWRMIKRAVSTPENPLGASGGKSYGRLVSAWFVNNEGRHKYLLFGLYDRKGRSMEPNDTRSLTADLNRKFQSWFRTGDAGGSDAEILCYQLQAFVDSNKPLTEPEMLSAFELHAAARAKIDSYVQNPNAKEGGSK